MKWVTPKSRKVIPKSSGNESFWFPWRLERNVKIWRNFEYIDQQKLSRVQKAPKLFENSFINNSPGLEDCYCKIFYEIIDQVLVSLKERFDSDFD